MTMAGRDEVSSRFLTGTGRFVADAVPGARCTWPSFAAPCRMDGCAAWISTAPAQHTASSSSWLPLTFRPVRSYPCAAAARTSCSRAASPSLATDRVRYVGQPVAVVAAHDRSSSEVPTIRAHVYEHTRAFGNPLGARGVGEAGIYGVAAAVANAVADATAARTVLTQLPLTPQRVREAVAAGRPRTHS